MNKEEILEKSRKDYNDEGMIQAENKGREIGFIYIEIVCIIITITKLYYNYEIFDIYTILFTIEGSSSYAMYKFTKKKSYLLRTIIAIVLGSLCLVYFWLDTAM